MKIKLEHAVSCRMNCALTKIIIFIAFIVFTLNFKADFNFNDKFNNDFTADIFFSTAGVSLSLFFMPAAADAFENTGNILKTGFEEPRGGLILKREARPFLIEDGFCETTYMPRIELDEGECHTVDLDTFYGKDRVFKSVEVITNSYPSNSLDITKKNNFIIFKLNKPAGIFNSPLDYRIEIFDFKRNKIDKIIKGSIIAAVKNCSAEIEITAASGIIKAGSDVYIAGDMNGWNAEASKLKYDTAKNAYYIKFENIKKGRYKYKLIIDGNWTADMSNPEKEPDGFGSYNSILTCGAVPLKDELIPAGITTENGNSIFKIEYSGHAVNPRLAFFYKGLAVETHKIKYDNINKIFTVELDENFFKSVIHLKPSILYYSFSHAGDGGIKSLSNEYCFYSIPGRHGTYNMKDAVIYFAMTDRFRNGDSHNDRPIQAYNLDKKCNFYGGDIDGIVKTARNGYFNSLGISILWISPILKGPSKAFKDSLPPHKLFTNYHGYWPKYLDKTEPRFCESFEQLRTAVKELRSNFGIEVILDAVLRHVTIDSPIYKKHPGLFLDIYFKDENGKKIKNIRLFDKYPESTWFDEFLPAFDYSKKDSIEYMAAHVNSWIEKTGVKGFRLDAVKHIPHDFWNALLKNRKNFFTVGETIDSREKIASYIAPGMLGAQFDFPLYFAIIETLAKNGGSDFKNLDYEIKKSEECFRFNHKLTSNLIGNHDFPRFMAYADGYFDDGKNGDGKQLAFIHPPHVKNPANYKKLKMAFALLCALDGIPLIYYGDEYGECGAGDPDNRRVMRFDDSLNAFEKNNLELTRRLLKIRQTSPALIEGVRLPLLVSDSQYVFAKIHFNDIIITAFNKSEKPIVIEFDAPGYPAAHDKNSKHVICEAKCYHDMISLEKFPVRKDGKIRLAMKPMSFRYLEILK